MCACICGRGKLSKRHIKSRSKKIKRWPNLTSKNKNVLKKKTKTKNNIKNKNSLRKNINNTCNWQRNSIFIIENKYYNIQEKQHKWI